MATAWQEYETRAKSLVFSREYSITSIPEAKAIKAELTQVQKELRQIKREIDLDIKEIRAVYAQRLATAAQKTSGLLTLMGKRAATGHARADEKRRLTQERDRLIQPYEALKFSIDSNLLQLDKTKVQVDLYIAEQSKS